MADYPDSLFTPRTVENRAGVSYDAAKTKVFYAEDINAATAEIVAIQETLGLNPEGSFTTVGDRLDDFDSQLVALSEDGGWRDLPVVPTRQSTDDPTFVLRFAYDMTGVLQEGMRIKVTQNGTVRYFIVVLVGSYSGGNTDVTVYGGTDYDVNDTSTYPISSPMFSREKAPFGFPLAPDKWTVLYSDTTLRSQSSATANTWYNLGGQYIDIFPGAWDIFISGYVGRDSTVAGHFKITLSTANNTESDEKNTASFYFSISINAFVSLFKRIPMVLTSKTRHYLNALYTGSSSSLYFNNPSTPFVVRVVSAYL